MFDNVIELINYIENLKKLKKKTNLNHMQSLCDFFSNPEKDLKIIHVAGTNGKGSVSSYIENILRENGYNVGKFTSPYVLVFNERIAYNGVNISDQDLLKYGNYIISKFEEMEKLEIYKPSFFEFMTLLAFLYFSKQKDLDYAIIEVGIGGLLDVTNIIEKPVLTITTSISLDHQNVLGETIEEIARQKLGILKEGVPHIALFQEGLENIFYEEALKKNVPLFFVRKEDFKEIKVSLEVTEFEYLANSYKVKLLGYHQAYNAALAILATKTMEEKGLISLDKAKVQKSLEQTYWPGRLEIISENPLILVDGAHNIGGIESLVNFIKEVKGDKKVIVYFAVSSNKAKDQMILKLDEVADEIVFSEFHYQRSDQAINLIDYSHLKNKRIASFEEIELKKINNTDPNSLILFTGSLYYVSEVIKKLKA
ncbi:MAG TPA: bifunctional folylpolyglutamate synthase/dihydrofolate synthase [Acholeplasma sp.]|nr:bifunctional folylpolyglutamate synthase/dihydrofolate synthase [Acholeplasma sp.]